MFLRSADPERRLSDGQSIEAPWPRGRVPVRPDLLRPAFDKQRLEGCYAGITTCESIVAQLGSILPHVHVVVAEASQVVPDLGTALSLMMVRHGEQMPSMLSFITGPSRTGDIERILVLGTHGPKELYLILIG
ncbi:MAG: LUD domain-containing protein [Verrucomicrobiota bacterium]